MTGSIAVLIACKADADELARICADIHRQSRSAREIVIAVNGSDDIHALQRIDRLFHEGVRRLRTVSNRSVCAFLEDPGYAVTDYVLVLTQPCEFDREFFAQAASTLDAEPALDYACSAITFGAEPTSGTKSPSALDVLTTGSAPHPAIVFRRRVMVEAASNLKRTLDDDLDFFVAALDPSRKGIVLSESLVNLLDRQGAIAPTKHRAATLDRLRRLYLTHLSDAQGAELLTRKDLVIEQEQQRSVRLGSLQTDLHKQVVDLRAQIHALTQALQERDNERVEWGDLRRLTPMSQVWGSDRGTPVNRYYIEQFLAANRRDIRGRVLEVKDPHYAQAFGTEVSGVDVLDINPANTQATIVADLTDARAMASEAFDCFILTQVLNVVFDCRAALANAIRVLRPGGVLLCTVASVDRVSNEDRGSDGDFWRFTAASLRTLLAQMCPLDHYEVTTHGNVMACAAHLFGLSAEELTQAELETNDPAFPLIIAARVVKPESGLRCADA